MNELYNIEELKTLNEDLQAQNYELQSQYGYYSSYIFIFDYIFFSF